MSLKDLRRRIQSVKATSKITSAMKMVASAKLRRLQSVVTNTKDYAQTYAEMLQNLGRIDLDLEQPCVWLKENNAPDLLIIIGAEKGLCGGFHHTLLKKAFAAIKEYKNCKILCIGKKVEEAFKDNTFKQDIIFDDQWNFHSFLKILETLEIMKAKGEINNIHVLYTAFKSVLLHLPTFETLTKFQFTSHNDKSFVEPEADEFLPLFLKHYIAAQIYKAWMESQTAEMAARMTAMDNATRNAKDMIDKLTLKYNRTRQAQITTELTEIIAGSEGVPT